MTVDKARAPSPDKAGEGRTPARAWWSLLAVALGIMVVQIDGTVVSVANPAIAADLGASPAGIQWVTTAYLLVFAALLIPAGTVADRIGRKRAFLIGVAGFSLASLLCGLAGSVEVLIGARVLQAVFAGLLGPAGLALLRAVFPADKLPRALGVFGAVTAAALAGGPMLGGALVEYASWEWVFFINLPFGVVGILIGYLVLRESAPQDKEPLDIPGAVTLTAAMLGVVWAISNAQTAGWLSVSTIGFAVLGLALVAVFVVIEKRRKHPMMPLSLFRDRSFSVGCVLMVVTMLAFFAILFYLTFFLQGVQGRSAVMTGVALLPLTAVFTAASPMAGWATSAWGNRLTLLFGAACTVVSLTWLLTLDASTTLLWMAPALLLAGFGAGFMLVPAIGVVIGSAPVDKAGVASGIQQSTQQLGGTLGIAVFGSIIASVVAARLPDALRDALGAQGVALAEQLGSDPQIQAGVALGFEPATQEALQQQLSAQGVPEAARVAEMVTIAAHDTFLSGLDTVFIVAAGATVVAGLLSLLVRNTVVDDGAGDEDAVTGDDAQVVSLPGGK